MLGGRAAEVVIFGDVTTGAADDLDKSTKLAREMVTEYGMSSLGLVSYSSKPMFGMWKNPFGESSEFSQATLAKIDSEVKRILDASFESAKGILASKRSHLDKIAASLLEVETLDASSKKFTVKVTDETEFNKIDPSQQPVPGEFVFNLEDLRVGSEIDVFTEEDPNETSVLTALLIVLIKF